MNEADTERVLNVVEDRFNQGLIMELEKAVGEAHIQRAKRMQSATELAISGAAQKEELPTNGDSTLAARPQSKPEDVVSQSANTKVDAFITKVKESTQRKVYRKDIWTVAGYKDPTQFQRFQRNSRVTASANANFERGQYRVVGAADDQQLQHRHSDNGPAE
jgi:hypothetical protein